MRTFARIIQALLKESSARRNRQAGAGKPARTAGTPTPTAGKLAGSAGGSTGSAASAQTGAATNGDQARTSTPRPQSRPKPAATADYPGDYTGSITAQYAPNLDGDADPGEIVWTWVPFEEDYSQGKDRPVLVIGTDGEWMLALMLTSKDHTRDLEREARYGRRWMDIGTGPWDKAGRPSEVRLDRIIRVDPNAIRREGAIVAKSLYDAITAAL